MASEAQRTATMRWNDAHYTQINVRVKKDIVAAFKDACTARGESIAGQFAAFMVAYAEQTPDEPTPEREPDYTARRKRKTAAAECAAVLSRIRDAEERSRDNMPENLQGSANYERADETVNALDEILAALEGLY